MVARRRARRSWSPHTSVSCLRRRAMHRSAWGTAIVKGMVGPTVSLALTDTAAAIARHRKIEGMAGEERWRGMGGGEAAAGWFRRTRSVLQE